MNDSALAAGNFLDVEALHERSNSGYSHNYSFLDFYRDDITENIVLLNSPIRAPSDDGNADRDTDAFKDSTTLTESVFLASYVPKLPVVDQSRIQAILESDHDMYGFNKTSSLFQSTKASYNEWFKAYLPHFITQKKKWSQMMKNDGLSYLNASECPTRFPPKSDKVKKLIRKGIPPEWRGNAWFFYAGGNEKMNRNAGVYHKIVLDTAGLHSKETDVIERDLDRTFPDNKEFKRKDSDDSTHEPIMITTLRRVLTAFALYQPQIGYCQSLNFIAGLLLLFMPEEHAFWMLVIMTERIIPKVHSANLEGVHTDQGVFMMCIKEYIPKLWAIIGKSFDGTILSENKILTRLPPLTLVTSPWFMSVFIGILPIESVLRIWDILWYEGSKTIFRISLTICRLCLDDPTFNEGHERLANASPEAEQIEVFQFMQRHPKSFTDPDLLINCCYKKIGGYGYGFLSQREIQKCREFVANERKKIEVKKSGVLEAEMNEDERLAMQRLGDTSDDDIHDVYGFNKSIMSGVAWNKHMSGMMRKKLAKKQK